MIALILLDKSAVQRHRVVFLMSATFKVDSKENENFPKIYWEFPVFFQKFVKNACREGLSTIF